MKRSPTWEPTLLNGKREDWIPLLDVGEAGSRIGLARSGYWLIGNHQECVLLDPQFAGVRVLPILEQDPVVVMETLSASLREHASKANIAELPARVAIEVGLSGSSDYWARLALDWLGIVGPSKRILELLHGAVDARWASQRTRQLASKLWRQFPKMPDS